ncbi:MAG TPA: hypothetical protein VLX30_14860 [Burkholderiales bacterium]|nr:hypothetical protein [Burkholderiales bacterium]
MRTFLRTLGIALGLAAASVPLPARAAITSAEPIPANSLVAIGQAHSLVLNWQVVSLAVGFPGTLPYTITSTSGQFRVGATVLGTVNTTLSANGSMVSGVPSTVTLAESVMVPPDVTLMANRLGSQTVSYVRVFTDGTAPVQASELIVIGGSGAGQFGITREALSFDDGAAVRVVQAGDALSARAEIDFSGSGSMSALWELAGPSSTAGEALYRELQQVTRGLIGREPEIVKSPQLPTDSPGYYRLRLRITQPLPGFDPPVLAYYVGEATSGARGGFTEMVVTAPGDGALFDTDTRFAWQPVAGAKVYKIELFGSPEGDNFGLPDIAQQAAAADPARVRAALAAPPAAGMIVTAAQTQIALSAATRARLRPRHSYFWRVQAIGADGSVIGAAQVRQLRVP